MIHAREAQKKTAEYWETDPLELLIREAAGRGQSCVKINIHSKEIHELRDRMTQLCYKVKVINPGRFMDVLVDWSEE